MQNSIPLTTTKPPLMKPTKISVEKAKSPTETDTAQEQTGGRNLKMLARLSKTPKLRFSPTAWAKLLFLRDYGDTEVGGFGITALDDLLYVEDVALVQQTCTGISVAFDDESVADFFDRQVDAGRKIEQFARIWVHTHPGNCPQPSLTDEDDLFPGLWQKRLGGDVHLGRRRSRATPGCNSASAPAGACCFPWRWTTPGRFPASDYGVWEEEYLANVH